MPLGYTHRRFINESLRSLRIQCCYRGTYFIDRTLTRINQRQINRCDREESFAFRLYFFSQLIPCPTMDFALTYVKIDGRNVTFRASLFS